MKQFYAYIRVSTVKQGEHGVSLEQQKEAIQRYSQKNTLKIIQWFQEQETAAKRGRPVFNQMLKGLRTGKATGVIIHKIDRSARNLKDWADLGELIDSGIEVHFANESLDLNSRGGRLSADIQAVVAADYIRNLREETKKGFYGRLKQGLYPRPAPLGYQDQGGGKVKLPDPIMAPLIRKAFELYSSGLYNLERLSDELFALGLRTKSGKQVQKSVLSRILNDPFYTGIIRIKKIGETYQGAHKSIVPASLFARVQEMLRGKVNRRVNKNQFIFRQMFTCRNCCRCLIGERHKGLVYYRCHAKACPSRTVREEVMDSDFIHHLKRLELTQEEKNCVRAKLLKLKNNWHNQEQTVSQALKLKLSQMDERQSRLTDAYLDQAIDKETFERRKTALLQERRNIQDQLDNLTSGRTNILDQLSELVELASTAYLAYKLGLDEEKRDLLKTLSSNRTLDGNTLTIMLALPFHLIANRFSVPPGRPTRTIGRDVAQVWDELIDKLSESVPAWAPIIT